MKKIILFSLALCAIDAVGFSQENYFAKVISDVRKPVQIKFDEIPKAKAARSEATTVTPCSEGRELVSPRTLDSGRLRLVSSRDWTSGFFIGELWLLSELTGKAEWRSVAEEYTSKMEREKTNAGTHDMGFK